MRQPSFVAIEKFWGVNARWPRNGQPIFLSHLATWDAAHYLHLSEVSYAKDVPSCAFYPLWPLLVRGFSVVTGGNHLIAGMILANLFSAAGCAVFFGLARERFGDRVAWLGLAFLFAFPGSLFFHFVYSEGLFFLVRMLFVLGLERRWDGLVWASGFLLPMTRAVGVFCVFPLVWQIIETRGQAVRAPGRLLLLGLAPMLGYLTYFGLMWHWTGNPWEGFQAQRFWNYVHSIGNLFDPWKFIVGFFTPWTWHEFRGSVLDRCLFLLLMYCLPVIWRLDKGWFLWALVLGVVPAMSGTFTSFTRFALVVFPMFLALGVAFSDRRLRWIGYALLGIFGILQVILVWRFVNFRWAG